mgnify:CR=1 FL=1
MPQRPRRHTTAPRVYEIAADLRSRIEANEFPPGSRLPSTRVLSQRYGISEQAIARVMRELKNEGLVVGRKGAGVFVREWNPLTYWPQSEFQKRPSGVDIFRALLDEQGLDGVQNIEVYTESPTEAIRARLQLAREEVAVRRRTSLIDGKPYYTDDSYVALDLVEGSDWMHDGSIERGTNQVLAELGYELVEAIDEIYIRMPKPDETERLALSEGTPVAELISTAHDASGRPIQVTVCVLPGDRQKIVYQRIKPQEEGA